ncbi:1-acyl-sn-glycerol-3-phosphate acyltransferase [Acetobacter sp. AN02]|uniref:lysophospholipid acyltransferase family protein n=1 Tax=Acetobacter sp. AN02 TaxID=2894186 RepID=UPI002434488A|nr:lysophospholipid acyltransferase family protein [Acetobacter sp. AN02]MDG6095034.1 1-acyl-sn-glycerol-3-phosphate acyltransferase [Acetobacter sp. AN02]
MQRSKKTAFSGRIPPPFPLSADDAAPTAWERFVQVAAGAVVRVRAAIRLTAIVTWAPSSVGFEALLLRVPGTIRIRWPRIIWSVLCKLIRVRLNVVGRRVGTVGGPAARRRGERPVIYVSNHSSWLDVVVLGAVLPCVFVAKGDIEKWPVMGWVCHVGRTIFVSRQRNTTGRERDTMISRLAGGDNVTLFPEGTSSDGSRVLPFMSAFFAIAKAPRLSAKRKAALQDTGEEESTLSFPPGMEPIIQPISVAYDRLDGMPVSRSSRPVFAWYGDMELGPHLWQLLNWSSMRATILLHPPLDPADFPSRKALAQAAWKAIADGAARIRQNDIPEIPDYPVQGENGAWQADSTSSLDNTGPSFA